MLKRLFFFRKDLPRKISMSIFKLNIHQKINYALVPDLYDVRNIFLLQFIPIAVAFVDLHR